MKHLGATVLPNHIQTRMNQMDTEYIKSGLALGPNDEEEPFIDGCFDSILQLLRDLLHESN